MSDIPTHDADDARADDLPPTDAVTDEVKADATGDSPIGGDENTEEQLESDNAVEDDMVKSLDPDDAPA